MSVKYEKLIINYLISMVKLLSDLDGCKFKQLYVEFEHGSYTCHGDSALVMKGVYHDETSR